MNRLIHAGVAAAFSVGTAQACTSNIVAQTGALPPLNGRLAFQASAASGGDHIYLYDFMKPPRVRIDPPAWGYSVAHNPDLSRNGAWIAYAAQSPSCADSPTSQYWQIYVYQIGNANAPAPLVACDKTNREDVKFSEDMGSVIYKRRVYTGGAWQYSLETLALTYNANGTVTTGVHSVLVQDTTERSAPNLSPMSLYAYFYIGSETSPQYAVLRRNLLNGQEQALTTTPGGYAYYPSVRDASTVIYVEHIGSATTDQLFLQTPNIDGLGQAYQKAIAFSDCNLNNSDPVGADEDYVLFSRPGAVSPYELYVGRLGTTSIWSLSSILAITGTDAISALKGSTYFPRLRGVAR